MQVEISHQSNLKDVGKVFEVLVEGVSKKKSDELFGRSSQNKVIVFPDNGAKVGELVQVRVTECTLSLIHILYDVVLSQITNIEL